jgi:hypothetical protein
MMLSIKKTSPETNWLGGVGAHQAKVRKAAAHVMSKVIPRLKPQDMRMAAEQLVLVLLHDAKASTRQAAFATLTHTERMYAPSLQTLFCRLSLNACIRHEKALICGLRSSVRTSSCRV